MLRSVKMFMLNEHEILLAAAEHCLDVRL